MLPLLLLAASTALGASSAAPMLTVKSHGKDERTFSLSALTKLVPAQMVGIWEPHERKEGRFQAFPMDQLLAKTIGEEWDKSEEILFTCSDGFQPSIPTSEFKAHRAYLAFAREGQTDFTVYSPDERKQVPMGPFYLVWENIHDSALQRQGTVPGWPYQVTTLDAIDFADRFPHMSPPGGSGPAADRGFHIFRKYCLSCHTINGEGGGKGAELNYPANPTEYYRTEWLKKWILEPRGIRYGAEMPGLKSQDAESARDIDDVIAYLTAMARAKRAPGAR